MGKASTVLSVATLSACLLLPACGWLHRDRAPAAPAPIDLNSASRRQIEKLPGVTPSMAGRIVEGRPYRDPYDLVERGLLTEREFKRLTDRVTVTPRD
jgi:DNA uptake protein ComE-like DNA-binding protein